MAFMPEKRQPTNLEDAPLPEQLFEIRRISEAAGAEQGKLRTHDYKEHVAFFLPREVDVVDSTDEAGDVTSYSVHRYIGRLSRTGDGVFRMLIAESKFTFDVKKSGFRGTRTHHRFEWSEDDVNSASREVRDHLHEKADKDSYRDDLQVRHEGIDAGDCLVLRGSIAMFAVKSLEAAREERASIFDQTTTQTAELMLGLDHDIAA